MQNLFSLLERLVLVRLLLLEHWQISKEESLGEFLLMGILVLKKSLEDEVLKEVVDQAIKEKVVFLGIGIQTEDVMDFYPEKNVAVIHDPNDIYQAVTEGLGKLIKRG